MSFIQSTTKQFEAYKQLGEKAMAQVSDEALQRQYNEDSNSIAMIVQHLRGNMLSRWTDFLTTDGEKEWRKRDAEFEPVQNNRADILKEWEEGWNCLFQALEGLTDNDLQKEITIRSQKHSVMEAIHRQLAHYAYHIGQIVYFSKMFSKAEWQSLSIPKGKSDEYNRETFK